MSNTDKITLLISDCRNAAISAENIVCYQDINDASIPENCTNAIAQFSGFNDNFIKTLLKFKQKSPKLSITLLTETIFLPMAIKLKDRGIADYILPSPLSDKEMGNLITDIDRLPLTDEPTLEKRIRSLERIAYTDDLTGLWNRRFIDTFLSTINIRNSNIEIKMSLLLFDIDDLKKYNDTYGHRYGDELIIQISNAMRNSFRAYDLVARIGGDEFIAVLWQLPEMFSVLKRNDKNRKRQENYPDDAYTIASRFHKYISEKENKIHATISGSVTGISNNINKLSDILESADKKLYQAKRSGKNIVID